MRVFVIAIGISRFDGSGFDSGLELRFAHAAAERLADYARLAWAEDDVRVHVLCDEHATLERVADSITAAEAHHPDLLVMFYAGHGGQQHSGRLALYSFNAPISAPDISSDEIDAWLEQVGATSTLLIVDACYAQGVVRTCKFFGVLPANVASRLYLCSCAADERAWEDEKLGLPIFTATLLELLATSTSTEAMVVAGELTTQLHSTVAARTYQLKQGIQQTVVSGGVATLPQSVPRIAGAKQSTALWSDSRRLITMRVLRSAVLMVAVTACIIQMLTYHVRPTADGRVELARGIAILAPFTPSALSVRADLPINLDPLLAGMSEPLRRRVMNGGLWGIWSQRDPSGRDGWFAMLTPHLARSSTVALLRIRAGDQLKFESEWDSFGDDAEVWDGSGAGWEWVSRAIAEQNFLWQQNDIDPLLRLKPPDAQGHGCSADEDSKETRELEFFTHLSTEEIYRALIDFQDAAFAGSANTFEGLANLAKVVAYRAHSKPPTEPGNVIRYNPLDEYRTIVGVAEHLGTVPALNLRDAKSSFGARFRDNPGCSDVALLLDMTLSDFPGDRAALRARIAQHLRTLMSFDGRWERPQQLAYEVARVASRHQLLSEEQFESIYRTLPEIYGDAPRVHPLRRDWVRDAWQAAGANSQAIDDALNERWLYDRSMLAVAGKWAAHLSPEQRTRVRKLVSDLSSGPLVPFSNQQSLAHLVSARIVEPAVLGSDWLGTTETNIDFPYLRSDQTTTVPLLAGSISWDLIIDLAEAAANADAPDAYYKRFDEIADEVALRQPPGIGSLYAALARRNLRDEAVVPSRIVAEIRRASTDARRLTTVTGMGAVRLLRSEANIRDAWIDELRVLWGKERCVQCRIAIAHVIFASMYGEPRLSRVIAFFDERIGREPQ